MTKTTTNISELFVSFIAEGQKAAALIVDNKDKAIAYASLAQACAMSGLVSPTTTAVTATKEDVINAYKESEQNAEFVAEAPVAKEAPTEDPAPAAEASATEEEETEVWTPYMQEKYKDELAFVLEQAEAFGQEALNMSLSNFSNGRLTNYQDDVNPLNVKGFADYLRQLIAELG